MKNRALPFVFLAFILTNTPSTRVLAFKNFHCKYATCQEFYLGLRAFPRYKHYVETCYDTVALLRDIPNKYGTCVDDSTNKINAACVHAVATTIKYCMNRLNDLPEKESKFFCGYTLMKNCAANVGLERFPLTFPKRNTNGY